MLTPAELDAWRTGADFWELCAVSRREREREAAAEQEPEDDRKVA